MTTQTTPRTSSRRAWKTLLVAFLLGLAGLVAVTLWLGEPGDLRLLLRLSGWTLAGAAFLLVGSFVAGGARLSVLLRMAGARLNIWRATRAHILGLFAAAITPSGGGNGVAIGFALQRDGIKANVAWSAAVYGSVLDLFFFAWALPVAGLLLHSSGLITTGVLLLLLAGSVLAVALWYGVAFHLGRVRHLVRPLLGWRVTKRWRRPILRFLDDVGAATSTISRGGWWQQLGLHALTALVHTGFYAIFHLFAQALGSDILLQATLSLMAIISAISQFVPTPGGAGYFEVALSFAFSQGGANTQITAAVVAYRALTYYVPIVLGGLLGGSVLISELSRANGTPEPEEASEDAPENPVETPEVDPTEDPTGHTTKDARGNSAEPAPPNSHAHKA